MASSAAQHIFPEAASAAETAVAALVSLGAFVAAAAASSSC